MDRPDPDESRRLLGRQIRTQEEQAGGERMRLEVDEQHEDHDGTLRQDRRVDQGIRSPSGDLILSPDKVAGWCAVCREEGTDHPVSTDDAARCARCGRLLCLGHQQTVMEGEGADTQAQVYCPTHAIRWGHAAVGCLLLFGVGVLGMLLLLRGCG